MRVSRRTHKKRGDGWKLKKGFYYAKGGDVRRAGKPQPKRGRKS